MLSLWGIKFHLKIPGECVASTDGLGFPKKIKGLRLETNGQTVVRKMDRKLPEYSAPLVAFFRALLIIVECALPNCTGHQKFGVVVEENIPVIFQRHDQGQPAIYVPFKNPISKPMKVPEDGENMLAGLKWRATDPSTLNDTWTAVQNIFDCLLADLRFRMMTKDFCLECLFAHTNGRGLLLERFIKTVLYHIFPWGRSKEKEQLSSLSRSTRKRCTWNLREFGGAPYLLRFTVMQLIWENIAQMRPSWGFFRSLTTLNNNQGFLGIWIRLLGWM